MKRYRYETYFIFVIALIFWAFELSAEVEARSVIPKMSCKKESKSFWLRHSCQDGFVTVKSNNRVYAQTDGISKHNSQAELIKEACRDLSAGIFSPVQTRLYSPSEEKYICFTKKGQVRALSRHHMQKMGKLCYFIEQSIAESDPTFGDKARIYVTMQSVHNPNWYLGFGPQKSKVGRHRGKVYTPDGFEALLPRQMSTKAVHPVRKEKCDFRFATGPYTPNNEHQWPGLIQHIMKTTSRTITKEGKKLEERLWPSDRNSLVEDPNGSDSLLYREMVSKNKFFKSKPKLEMSQPQVRKSENSGGDEDDNGNGNDNDDAPPLPAPVALKRRKTSRPSYFFDHNKRRNEDSVEGLQDLDVQEHHQPPVFANLFE